MLALAITASSIVAELLIVVAIALILFLTFKIGKLFLRIIFGFIANTILGFVSLLLLNAALGLGIPYSMPVIISTIIFGLPGVGTIVIFKLSGIALGASLL